jgi:hypothetical protein
MVDDIAGASTLWAACRWAMLLSLQYQYWLFFPQSLSEFFTNPPEILSKIHVHRTTNVQPHVIEW